MKKETVKKIVPFALVALAALSLGFGSGYALGKSPTASIDNRGKTSFGNGTDYQRNAGAVQGGMRQGRTVVGGFGGVTSGTVLSKDAQSITLQNRTGGSSVVFLAPSTTVSELADTSVDSLTVGDTVTVMGKANPDGSIMASAIQIRPLPANNDAPGLPGAIPTPVK